MSDAERLNQLHQLDLRHDELLQMLADLDQQVEAAIALIRPPAASETKAQPAQPPRKKPAAA